jgi:hypothetical protein
VGVCVRIQGGCGGRGGEASLCAGIRGRERTAHAVHDSAVRHASCPDGWHRATPAERWDGAIPASPDCKVILCTRRTGWNNARTSPSAGASASAMHSGTTCP